MSRASIPHQGTITPVFKVHGIQFFSLFGNCRVTCQVFPSHLIWHEAGQKADANYEVLPRNPAAPTKMGVRVWPGKGGRPSWQIEQTWGLGS